MLLLQTNRSCLRQQVEPHRRRFAVQNSAADRQAEVAVAADVQGWAEGLVGAERRQQLLRLRQEETHDGSHPRLD